MGLKLITETNEDINFICEADEKSGKKNYFIEGIFMQAEQKNRNGRIYPTGVLMPVVEKYNKDYVAQNRALGELNHPTRSNCQSRQSISHDQRTQAIW